MLVRWADWLQHGEKLGADLATRLKGVVKNALVTAESHIRTNARDASQ